MGNGNEVSKDEGKTEFCSINSQVDMNIWHIENSKHIHAHDCTCTCISGFKQLLFRNTGLQWRKTAGSLQQQNYAEELMNACLVRCWKKQLLSRQSG